MLLNWNGSEFLSYKIHNSGVILAISRGLSDDKLVLSSCSKHKWTLWKKQKQMEGSSGILKRRESVSVIEMDRWAWKWAVVDGVGRLSGAPRRVRGEDEVRRWTSWLFRKINQWNSGPDAFPLQAHERRVEKSSRRCCCPDNGKPAGPFVLIGLVYREFIPLPDVRKRRPCRRDERNRVFPEAFLRGDNIQSRKQTQPLAYVYIYIQFMTSIL